MAEELPVEAMSPEAKPKSSKSESNAVMQGLYYGTEEESFQQSSYYPDSQKKPYNPDPLVQKDFTYGLYEDMINDDQVDVALNLKKDLVVGSGWHISSSDDDLKKQIEALLEDEIDRPLSEVLQDIIQAYEFGFSLSEKIFKNLDDGRLALKDIKPRHPSTWLIHTDVHGNVTRYEQRGTQNSIDVNPSSLIHYVNNQRHQNPYGRSDLQSAYQAWLTKRHVTRFYAIFLENAAGPKPVAKYDRRAPQGVVDDIFNAIKKLQTKTALVIPKDFEMEFLEAKNSGEAYIKGINLFNMFIGRALFIPDLIGFSGGETGGGSFSLGKEQIGLFYKHIYRRREILERIMDQHVIRPLCIYNYGLMDEYPKFKFNPLSEEDAGRHAELWIKGVQGAGWQPTPEEVNHFRSLVKFPESESVEMKQSAPTSGFGPSNETEKPEPDDKEMPEKKEFALKLDSLPGNYKAKVDFKLADNLLKTAVSKMQAELAPVVDDIFEDLYDQLQKKKIVQKQDLSKAENIQLKYLGKMQTIIKKHFRNLYNDGAAMAKTEVKKSDFAVNIPADEFLEFLNQETFKYIGDWSYTITKKTKDALITAIKDGKSLSSVITVLDDEGKRLSDVSLERYARTKSTEVFNKGRMEYFESTGVVAAYQFSAILDDVTSEICTELNGKVFEKTDAPIPPLHFNCRSVLIPITRFEEWSADSKTNSGKSIDKTLERLVEDKGFSVFHTEHECKRDHKTNDANKPQITDPNVEFQTEFRSPTQEVITYSAKGQIFQITTVDYETNEKKKVKSIQHKRVD